MPIQQTNISWADYSGNAWKGCAKVSAGCENCYAERMFVRRGLTPKAWTVPNIDDNLQVYSREFDLGAVPEPGWVFAPSSSDPCLPWLESVRSCPADDCEGTVWVNDPGPAVCEVCGWSGAVDEPNPREGWLAALHDHPEHVYLVLTKWGPDERGLPAPDLPDNGMLGVSVESPEVLPRLDWLRHQDVAMRFASFEPLIEEIPADAVDLSGIDWMIVGGESHKNNAERREMDPEWARELYEAAETWDVPFYFKQHSDAHAESNTKLAAPSDWIKQERKAFPETPDGVPDTPAEYADHD